MNPYELMLELRKNRILFQYMEQAAVTYDDKGWTIQGESEEGTLYIYETTSNILRFVLPISIPKEIPLEALSKIVMSAQEKLEGILSINYSLPSIEYFIHASSYDEKGLDSALIKFCQEKAEVKKGLYEIAESVKQIIKSMNLEQSLTKGYASPFPGPPKKTEDKNVWDTMSDLEKNIKDEPFDKEDKSKDNFDFPADEDEFGPGSEHYQ